MEHYLGSKFGDTRYITYSDDLYFRIPVATIKTFAEYVLHAYIQ